MTKRRLFALSDPHLSFASDKPMDVFGPHWRDHASRIEGNWRDSVGPDDVVLIPGDISWGIRLDKALPDLEWLAALPGEKIMVRGNHDYWWQSLGKLNRLGLKGMHFIQNNQVIVGGLAVGGSRLWDFPDIVWPFDYLETGGEAEEKTPKDLARAKREGDPLKIRAREMDRLRLSLSGLPKVAALKVAVTHFPPLGEDGAPTPITDVISRFGVDICVFGHIHAPSSRRRPGEDVVIGGTRYVLAASDHLGHKPIMLAEFE
ncbi:MAG: metallophosphoesterase [Planctomycetota bacterium]|jgi:predicted phosphohydrolase|nr:metallophosphoesterase [Planctomycetota bacterium]